MKTIALVDWNWSGHHPGYFRLFVRVLLELGGTVLALCPKPEEVDGALGDLDASARARLTIRSLTWAHPPRFFPRRADRRGRTLLTAYRLRKQLRRWEKENGKSIDLVFFACIYDYEFRRFREAQWLLPCRWSGLYLHCRSFRIPGSVIPQTGELPCPEQIFRSSKLHSIAVLDEGAASALERLSGRPVVSFPDLTEEEVDPQPTDLEKKISRFAAGAPIVSALGHLQYTKGVTTLARLALDPANRDLFFLFAGDIDWYSFKPEDRALLRDVMDRRPNAYTHLARIANEPIFNSVIRASDVVFAAYLDFPNSSGILTKAAVFHKPIIVSEGYLMAERTRKYRLGEVVPEGNAEATGRAIREILQDRKAWLAARRPDWDGYHEQHCYPRLKEAFAALLAVK